MCAGLLATAAAAGTAAGTNVLDAPPGVKLAAFGLKGLKELAFALSLNDDVLTEEGIPLSALSAVAPPLASFAPPAPPLVPTAVAA